MRLELSFLLETFNWSAKQRYLQTRVSSLVSQLVTCAEPDLIEEGFEISEKLGGQRLNPP